jgi:hypothetical protein
MDLINNIVTSVTGFFCCAARKFHLANRAWATVEMECNMRSLSTKLVLPALGFLTIFASPAFAQEPHYHHRYASLHQSDPVGPRERGIYNMMITPNLAPTPDDDPAATGGGSVGYNENLRENVW